MTVLMIAFFGALGAALGFMFSDTEVHDAVHNGTHVDLHHKH